jgi:tetratricopeptide (TPR) repeat protein
MIDFNGKRNIFSKPHRTSSPLRIFLGLIILGGLLFVLRGFSVGTIKPILAITPTPTRTLKSYAQEGETHFLAGNLEKAIAAYQNAVLVDPNNPDLWSELARIQVYSTSQITTDSGKKTRLEEALKSIENGLKSAPEDSKLYAVKAFALDWYGVSSIAGPTWQDSLIAGEQAAVQALQYDNTNALALAYYSELLVDGQKWTQAEQYIKQALALDPTLMDVHRVNGYVLESTANYKQAIEEYLKAIDITPNLNFLYISLGANYRKLANLSEITPERDFYFGLALEAFAKAAGINNQLNVKDPIPLISIANTYVQQGQFLAASRNMLKAIQFVPNDPTVYGQLGIVYYKARNYEGSILPLRCAVRGCDAATTCLIRNGGVECTPANIDPDIVFTALPLTQNTVIYYYIYGSVLAGLHQPANGYCEEAMKVFKEITASFGNDVTIMNIVKDGVGICNYYGYQ